MVTVEKIYMEYGAVHNNTDITSLLHLIIGVIRLDYIDTY